MELAEQNNNLVQLLDDLVKINCERIEGYNIAHETMRDNKDLKSIFRERIHQSENFILDLKELISKRGGEKGKLAHISGKIFNTWMNFKNTFKSNKNASILDNCEFGENVAVKVYDEALKSDTEIPADIRQKIIDQQNEIKKSHDFIKKFRDFNLDLTA